MYCEIVSPLRWFDNNRESDFGKIWLHDAAIVGVIGFPFFTHKEIKGGTDRRDEGTGAITRRTRVVSISYIFCCSSSIYHFSYHSSVLEPFCDFWIVIVGITRTSAVMVLSLPFCKFDIPTVGSLVESRIIGIATEPERTTIVIVPANPSRSNLIHINSLNSWLT